ncbi:hypothetical protein B0H11DRAFT_2228199 [Mycena galericulata]|nr:hypothetical protein B0H11DRAFT_2228199 [Mycena galericulata]
MDDPWANAWGEPTTTTKHPPPPVFPTQDVDDEEDITIPSWEAPVSWTDENSLWGSRSPAVDRFPSWQSPYDDLPLGKASSSPPTTSDVPEDTEEASEDEAEQEQLEPEPQSEPEPEILVEPPTQPPFDTPLTSPPLSSPSSPDAFGTFESGLHDLPPTSDPWTPSHAAFAPDSADSAWGTAWAPSGEEGPGEEDDTSAVVDEWEAAKQQKAMQDKHVPPELLASILLQFTELANDLYPPQPTPTPDPDDYRASRHKGMQGIDSLNPTVIRLLPTDLTLPPPRPFLKSAIAKQTADSLRLSRSAAFVRFSPLSHYSATKGSTAWEASVKRRPEAVGEPDLLPPGWRVVDTKKDEAVVDKKKTGHGGLLSFFGRRAGTPPVVASGEGANPRRSLSSAPGSSPRASMDSTKSPTASIKSPTNASAAASPTMPSSTPPPLAVVPVVSQTQPDAGAGADTDPTSPASAPSAVSRFLGRFGRKAPAATGPQNLALSEGDFDFLSDIEGAPTGPAFNDAAFSGDAHFSITGALLDDPVPLPAKLAPPPRPFIPVVPAQKSGHQGRPGIDPDVHAEQEDELAIFGTYIPPPPTKPQFAHSVSAPAPAPKSMPPVDSDIDFSAWGFDDEEKSGGVVRRDSEPVASARTIHPPAKQVLNTRAVTNARGSVPPPRRAPTAIMSSGPSKPPPIVPKLDGSFNFPPPPRTQTQTPIAVLPPPPGTKAVKSAAALLDDDDEFSDFHAPAAAQISPSQPSANSLYDTSFSSSSSERGLFSATSSTSIPANLFDDFDDFMQASPQGPTTLRTPSPPRPPSKHARMAPPTPLSFTQSTDPDDTPLALIANASGSSLRSKRAAASHQRTLSLVESAAATSGIRWPAPASPLPSPRLIAPPPDAADPFNFGGSTMQSQQAAFLGSAPTVLKAFQPPAAAMPIRAMSPPVPSPAPPQKMPARFPPPPGAAAPTRAMSPPAFPPPPGGVQKAQAAAPVLPSPMLKAQRTPALPTPSPVSSAAPGKSSGGLSAQDLSFFEGL